MPPRLGETIRKHLGKVVAEPGAERLREDAKAEPVQVSTHPQALPFNQRLDRASATSASSLAVSAAATRLPSVVIR